MARLIKHGSYDDGEYPMPRGQEGAGGAGQHAQQGGEAPEGGPWGGVEPAELQHALSELQEMVGLVHGMRPQVAELAEVLRSTAREQGYQEGIAKAQGEVQAQLMQAIEGLTEAGRERHRIALDHESALAELATTIARRVINAQLELDPTLVQRIVKTAIEEIEPSISLVAHVNPDDYPSVMDAKAELDRLVTGDGEVHVESDPSVDRGGVVLRSPVGEVDARIESKLSVLETAFAAQRRRLADGEDPVGTT